ncbi:MAG: XdhC family protein [Coprococcus sp.]
MIVTRGHQYDVDCMHAILGKRHSYIGMMGSRVRVKNLKAGLLEEGYDQMLLDSVHMPIGLKIPDRATPRRVRCLISQKMIQCRKKLHRGLLLFFEICTKMLAHPAEGIKGRWQPLSS